MSTTGVVCNEPLPPAGGHKQTLPLIFLMKSRKQVEVEINVFLQNSNLLKTGATKNRNLNYVGWKEVLHICYLHSPDSCSHSPGECGLAWAAIEEAVHRTSQLDIQLQISILPYWPSGNSCHLLTEMLCFHFLRVRQRLHTTHFITGLCLVLEHGPTAVPGTGFSAVELQKSLGLCGSLRQQKAWTIH